MEKNKKIITIAIIALIISLVSVGIAFAALNQDLEIEGAAEMDPASWDVRFDTTYNTIGLALVELGDAESATTPNVTATSISSYSVRLTKPGDAVRYTFVVENNGSLDAIITNISKDDPTCTSSIGNTADATLVCDNLIYKLTYNTPTGIEVGVGDTIAKASGTATQRTMVLSIEYDADAEEVPTDDVTINIPTVTITYEQD